MASAAPVEPLEPARVRLPSQCATGAVTSEWGRKVYFVFDQTSCVFSARLSGNDCPAVPSYLFKRASLVNRPPISHSETYTFPPESMAMP